MVLVYVDVFNAQDEIIEKSTFNPQPVKDDEGNDILVFNGRYGPYVKCNGVNRSLPKDKGIFDLTKDEAVTLLSSKPQRRGQATLKDLGKDSEGRAIARKSGR